MAKVRFQDVSNVISTSNNSDNASRSNVSFFMLKNDGDEAIVRFMHDSVDSFDIHTCHVMNIDGRFRNVECIREPMSPISECPLCASKERLTTKMFIRMIQYVKDPETGAIKAMPVIWDRGISYAKTLKDLLDEYGPLSNCIFKIKRSGAAKSMDTKYSIMLCSPAVYKNELYPIIPDAFDNYTVLNNVVVLNKDYNEMAALVGMTPATESNDDSITVTPIPNRAAQASTTAPTAYSTPAASAPTATAREFSSAAPSRPRRY